MRKLIDIPDEIVQDLKILAVKQNKDLKNYIQDVLVDLAKPLSSLQKKSTTTPMQTPSRQKKAR
jgi:hypothetical protein